MASSSKGSGRRAFNPVMSGSSPAEVTIWLLRLIRFRTPASQAGNVGFKSHRSHHIRTDGGIGIRTRLRTWVLWVRVPLGVPYGGMSEWSKEPDCKSDGATLRWFGSSFPHHMRS